MEIALVSGAMMRLPGTRHYRIASRLKEEAAGGSMGLHLPCMQVAEDVLNIVPVADRRRHAGGAFDFQRPQNPPEAVETCEGYVLNEETIQIGQNVRFGPQSPKYITAESIGE